MRDLGSLSSAHIMHLVQTGALPLGQARRELKRRLILWGSLDLPTQLRNRRLELAEKARVHVVRMVMVSVTTVGSLVLDAEGSSFL